MILNGNLFISRNKNPTGYFLFFKVTEMHYKPGTHPPLEKQINLSSVANHVSAEAYEK